MFGRKKTGVWMVCVVIILLTACGSHLNSRPFEPSTPSVHADQHLDETDTTADAPQEENRAGDKRKGTNGIDAHPESPPDYGPVNHLPTVNPPPMPEKYRWRATAEEAAHAHRNAMVEGAAEPVEAAPPCSKYKGSMIGTLFGDISEVSGLACGTSDVLWIHEDSGTSSTLYGIRKDGTLLGKWLLGYTLSTDDWEDIAILRRPDQPSTLWMGDIGDNRARETGGKQGRHSIKIIRAKEPNIKASRTPIMGNLSHVEVFEFTYPGRPYDAEALTVDPVTGDLYIFTKELGNPAPIFVARAPVKNGVLEKIGEIDLPWITAADFAMNGRELIVRNYLIALHYERKTDQTWTQVLAQEPTIVPLMLEQQGESIGFAPDASGFFTLSEGRSVPLYFYEKQCRGDTE